MQTATQQRGLPSARPTQFTLRCGPAVIPLEAYPAVASNRLTRREFADGDPVGRLRYSKGTGRVVDRSSVTKRVQSTGGQQVSLSDAELDRIIPVGHEALVEAFIPTTALWDGTYISQSTYFVLPAVVGQLHGTDASPTLAALSEAMRSEHVAALVLLSLGSRMPRYAALLPDRRLLVLAFSEEVRRRPSLLVGRPDLAEIELARGLVRAVGTGTPPLKDVTGARLRRYIDAKAAGGSKRGSGSAAGWDGATDRVWASPGGGSRSPWWRRGRRRR